MYNAEKWMTLFCGANLRYKADMNMEKLIRESFLYRLLQGMFVLYQKSAVCACVDGTADWFEKRLKESVIMGVLCREGGLAKAWEDSFACRLLKLLVNLPALVLHRIYQWLRPLFDNSFFAGLAFEAGEESAVAQSWLIMLLWCLPYKRWNNAYHFMGFLLLLALFYVRGMRNRKAEISAERIGFYPVLLFGAICVAGVLSTYPFLSRRFLLYHVSAALCVILTASSVRNEADLKRLTAGGGIAATVASLYAVYQRIQGVEVKEAYVDLATNPNMPGRVESFFDNPNTFAEVLILLLPLLVALMFGSKRWASRVVAAGCFAVGVLAMGMTYSRASWIGLACAAVVFVFLWRPKLIPLMAVAGVACIPLLPDTILTRILSITNLSDTSTSSRIPLYRAALATIKSAPLTGAGLGTAAVQQYIKVRNLYHGRAPYVHAHNIYLEIWVETGILGVIGFVGSMLWNIKNMARTVRRSEHSAARTITAACCAAMCGIMVAGLADNPWNYPRVMVIFWFVFALGIAGIRVCGQKAE